MAKEHGKAVKIGRARGTETRQKSDGQGALEGGQKARESGQNRVAKEHGKSAKIGRARGTKMQQH